MCVPGEQRQCPTYVLLCPPSLVPREVQSALPTQNTDAESQQYLVILYKELEHPGILVSVRVFDTEILSDGCTRHTVESQYRFLE